MPTSYFYSHYEVQLHSIIQNLACGPIRLLLRMAYLIWSKKAYIVQGISGPPW